MGQCVKYIFTVVMDIACPFGVAGDRLWVRETFMFSKGADSREKYIGTDSEFMLGAKPHYFYRATDPSAGGGVFKWRPSVQMPRHASRITLEIEQVRVEQLQDISEADAAAEGCRLTDPPGPGYMTTHSLRHAFMNLWNTIHGPNAWRSNQWVWVIAFKRVQA